MNRKFFVGGMRVILLSKKCHSTLSPHKPDQPKIIWANKKVESETIDSFETLPSSKKKFGILGLGKETLMGFLEGI